MTPQLQVRMFLIFTHVHVGYRVAEVGARDMAIAGPGIVVVASSGIRVSRRKGSTRRVMKPLYHVTTVLNCAQCLLLSEGGPIASGPRSLDQAFPGGGL